MRIIFFLLTLTALVWSSIGNVGALKGSATIIRNSNTLDVKNGMVLEVKDKIITTGKSRVQVILKDNTVVTIGQNSTFIFDAYKFGSKDESEVKMHIDRGFFRSVTGKIGKLAPERFKVKTASSTIGIRGTDFSALVSEQKETISCYKGSVNVFIGNTSHIINAGMMIELFNGNTELKALSKNIKLRTIDKKVNPEKIKADEIADLTQQEVHGHVTPLSEPTVEFPDR